MVSGQWYLENRKEPAMTLRKITSLTALISFLFILLTSIILYIVPHGRIAYWSDWRLWGLSKTEWGNLHINLGVLFLLSIFLHIYYNWKPIVNYLKNKARQTTVFTPSFNAALLVTLVFAFGTYFMVPPFSTILNIGESIKDDAALKYGEPPFGHAELAPLNSLIKKSGLDPKESSNRLESAGIKFDTPDDIMLDIARKNQMTPKAIFQIMQPEKKPGQRIEIPEIPAPGTGSKTLSQFCTEYGLDIDTLSKDMRLKGFKVAEDKKLKTLAQENQMSPVELYDLIKTISKK